MNAEAAALKVSDHAVQRYRERHGCIHTAEYARRQLCELLEYSYEVVYRRPGVGALKALKHRAAATYHKSGQWIIVVSNDTIATVYEDRGQFKRAR